MNRLWRKIFHRRIRSAGKGVTLRQICGLMGMKVPDRFKQIADQVNDNLTLTEKRLEPGGIMFLMFDHVAMKERLDRLVKKGARIIFVDKEEFQESGLNLQDYPCILMDNKLEQTGQVFSTIRQMYRAKTLAITGTVGKTTTNRFCNAIISKEYRTFASGGNLNSYMAVASHIFSKLTDELDVYIQEVGAAAPDSVRKAGRMLKPDAFILLNVTRHHMNRYGTFESLFADKVSMDDYLSEEGIVIANYDDEAIAAHPFKHKVISFGIDTDKEVDYRARNIVQNQELLEFDVEYKDVSTHIRINILGKHNAYNALAAFAAAKWLEIDDEKIVKHLLSYRSRGIRQNLQNIGGRYFYMDCYNVCEASILATAEAFDNFPISEGNRKIAVIGGENKLGEYAREISTRIGVGLSKTNLDEILCFGTEKTDQISIDKYGDAVSMIEGIRQEGDKPCRLFTDLQYLADYIGRTVKVGDVIIFKGIYLLDMAVAADKAFGTAFSYDYEYYRTRALPLQEGSYIGIVIPVFGEAELTEVTEGDVSLVIPDTLEGYPLFRIGKRTFQKQHTIERVDFGNSVRNIGMGAFFDCSGLRELHIPGNVKVIERGAFRKCTGLTRVILEEGVTHIGQNAFRSNKNLEEIVIPSSVRKIETGAFENSKKTVIICDPASYAEIYAKENHIPYIYKKKEIW